MYLEPNYVLAHFALGNLAKRQGLPAESLKHFRNALSALDNYGGDEILPESDGMTAARMTEITRSMISTEGSV